VIQVRTDNLSKVEALLEKYQLKGCSHRIGTVREDSKIRFSRMDEGLVFESDLISMQKAWSETSYQIQSIRDNSDCAQQEFDGITDDDAGINVSLSFYPSEDVAAPLISSGVRPSIAVLREQGVNGQIEMAAAFDRAGFDSVDVHMSDIINNNLSLDDFKGLVACGGFSYGDVLGAGEGWAKSILFNSRARDVFSDIF